MPPDDEVMSDEDFAAEAAKAAMADEDFEAEIAKAAAEDNAGETPNAGTAPVDAGTSPVDAGTAPTQEEALGFTLEVPKIARQEPEPEPVAAAAPEEEKPFVAKTILMPPQRIEGDPAGTPEEKAWYEKLLDRAKNNYKQEADSSNAVLNIPGVLDKAGVGAAAATAGRTLASGNIGEGAVDALMGNNTMFRDPANTYVDTVNGNRVTGRSPMQTVMAKPAERAWDEHPVAATIGAGLGGAAKYGPLYALLPTLAAGSLGAGAGLGFGLNALTNQAGKLAEAPGMPGQRVEQVGQEFADNPRLNTAAAALPLAIPGAAQLLGKVGKGIIGAADARLGRMGLSGQARKLMTMLKGSDAVQDFGSRMHEAGIDKARNPVDWYRGTTGDRMTRNIEDIMAKEGPALETALDRMYGSTKNTAELGPAPAYIDEALEHDPAYMNRVRQEKPTYVSSEVGETEARTGKIENDLFDAIEDLNYKNSPAAAAEVAKYFQKLAPHRGPNVPVTGTYQHPLEPPPLPVKRAYPPPLPPKRAATPRLLPANASAPDAQLHTRSSDLKRLLPSNDNANLPVPTVTRQERPSIAVPSVGDAPLGPEPSRGHYPQPPWKRQAERPLKAEAEDAIKYLTTRQATQVRRGLGKEINWKNRNPHSGGAKYGQEEGEIPVWGGLTDSEGDILKDAAGHGQVDPADLSQYREAMGKYATARKAQEEAAARTVREGRLKDTGGLSKDLTHLLGRFTDQSTQRGLGNVLSGFADVFGGGEQSMLHNATRPRAGWRRYGSDLNSPERWKSAAHEGANAARSQSIQAMVDAGIPRNKAQKQANEETKVELQDRLSRGLERLFGGNAVDVEDTEDSDAGVTPTNFLDR